MEVYASIGLAVLILVISLAGLAPGLWYGDWVKVQVSVGLIILLSVLTYIGVMFHRKVVDNE